MKTTILISSSILFSTIFSASTAFAWQRNQYQSINGPALWKDDEIPISSLVMQQQSYQSSQAVC